MSDEKRLEELVDLVSDLQRIDEDDPRVTHAGDDASRVTAENLRVLGAIAAFGREAWDREADGHPSAWGPLTDLEPVGADARGRLFRARHGDEAVLLRLLADVREDPSQARLRLVEEATRLRDHPVPGVRRVLGVERHDDRTGIWWEAGDAIPVSPDEPEPIALLRAAALALVGLHGIGLVHRRVTADRLLRVGDGFLFHDEPGERPSERGPGEPEGKDLAPEVRRGAPPGPRTDVFALGRLAGERLGAVPALRREIDRALDPEPDRRHSDPVTFVEALAGADPAPPR